MVLESLTFDQNESVSMTMLGLKKTQEMTQIPSKKNFLVSLVNTS